MFVVPCFKDEQFQDQPWSTSVILVPGPVTVVGYSAPQRRVAFMNIELSGKRAIVTGGSRGIGRAIARAFAGAGAAVSICARGAEALSRTRDEIASCGFATTRRPATSPTLMR